MNSKDVKIIINYPIYILIKIIIYIFRFFYLFKIYIYIIKKLRN